MTRYFHGVLCTLLMSALSAMPALAAPPEGKGKPDKHPHSSMHGKPKHESGYDGDSTRALVRAGITAAVVQSIIRERHIDLGSYAALPPGIRKNLARGKPLPPGIAKRGVPLPLLESLPHYPGYEWTVAGRDLVLLAIGSAIVADILRDVF
ncbi:anti-virulence regulator CigR family protein [Craterilacuibacter sp. RT1T]|uniref:anti-virulence regulator CigR family protein n=1 Tax=Craterilacuibacter sp. RT1T TaxID=2942211 RepID=UPI0020BDFB0F|nr:anti-virulence regulator CigR family protein [Craterilacuibacter sp. RT1T]MCL6264197.1 anti-virulence regulator CigR family protein [Craterilacuibacter sp. RT1T]